MIRITKVDPAVIAVENGYNKTCEVHLTVIRGQLGKLKGFSLGAFLGIFVRAVALAGEGWTVTLHCEGRICDAYPE